MKFDRYTIVGLLCALPYLIFGVVLTDSNGVSILAYLILTLALTGAEVTLYDMMLSSRRKNWLYRVPFSVLFFLVQFILGWNVMIPFYVMGQFALGVATTKDRFEHMPKNKAAKPLIISVGASVVYLLIALITGVNA
ncbi:MAG: hypothetical protein IIY12_05930 [Clostridia bacterium]|jgi:hypothetical protein|nr:hypothetical protein [Clostridia bacterium]MBQ1965534.1 hypothetical protein [Clostridia bacterium]MBQ5743324.1 hypothetical protein [Clostridia bacterium]